MNQNQGKRVGEPCAYCGTPLIQGSSGAYCKPCYIKFKNGGKTSSPARTQPKLDVKDDDIRANVALKMVSELIASGKVELDKWKFWADTFYHYKPAFATPPKVNVPNVATTDRGYQNLDREYQGEDDIPVENIPF
jgi:hypothetical protein